MNPKINKRLTQFLSSPLPVGSTTKATPLDYVNHGNGTIKFGKGSAACGPDQQAAQRPTPGNDEPERPPLERRGLKPRYPYDPEEIPLGWNKQVLPHDDIPPPVAILPNGPRHEFDPNQNYVSWSMLIFSLSGYILFLY